MSATVPIRPMNEQALRYPTANPGSLSGDARTMYEYLSEIWPTGQLDRDVFDPAVRDRFVPAAQGAAFRLSDRMEKAIQELVNQGLADRSPGRNRVLIKPVHEHYTIAAGRGAQFIRISTFDEHPLESTLLVVIAGGDVQSREAYRGGTEITVSSIHEDATDEEHSPARTSHLTIRNPSRPDFNGYGQLSFTGVLTSARLYPFGADPLKQEDPDTGHSQQVCTDCDQDHPLAPYLPPEARWLNHPVLVSVEVLPLRPYLITEPPAPHP